MSREFVALLSEKLPALGYPNRSQFIREAIVEKLVADGVHVPANLQHAPTRVRPRPPVPDPAAEDLKEPKTAAEKRRATVPKKSGLPIRGLAKN